MKKVLSIILVLLSLIFILCSCGQPPASPVEDFEYEFEHGEVKITGYIGSDLEIVIPDTIEDRPVTAIGGSAFENYDLVSVTLSNNIRDINSRAFRWCKNLKIVNLSNNLEYIGSGAFLECDIENIVIPDSVESIGDSAFYGCSNLKTVSMSDDLFEEIQDDFIGDGQLHYGIFKGCDDLKINNIPIYEFE